MNDNVSAKVDTGRPNHLDIHNSIELLLSKVRELELFATCISDNGDEEEKAKPSPATPEKDPSLSQVLKNTPIALNNIRDRIDDCLMEMRESLYE